MVHVLWLLLVSAGWSEVKYMKREKLRNLIYGGCEQQDKLGASGRRVGRSTAPCPSPAGRDLHGWQNGEKTKIKVDWKCSSTCFCHCFFLLKANQKKPKKPYILGLLGQRQWNILLWLRRAFSKLFILVSTAMKRWHMKKSKSAFIQTTLFEQKVKTFHLENSDFCMDVFEAFSWFTSVSDEIC